MNKYHGHWTERFWGKVKRSGESDCWEWQGSRVYDEYGVFKLKGKQFRAHRIAYELVNGPIPDGLIVMHQCDNPRCCNPAHLCLGTPRDNSADCAEKGRHAVIRGAGAPAATLTPDDVELIRAERQNGTTLIALATRFGVSAATISRAARKITYIEHVRQLRKYPRCKHERKAA